MYFDNTNDAYVFSIAILLLIFPISIIALRERILFAFKFKAFVAILNKTIKYQLIIGVTLLAIMFGIDNLVYSNGLGNTFTNIVIQSSYVFIVFGIFMYLPFIALLNGIVWLTNKLSK